MADVTRTAEVIFKGVNEMTPVIKEIETEIKGMDAVYTEAARNLRNFDDGAKAAFDKTQQSAQSAAVGVKEVADKAEELQSKPTASIEKFSGAASKMGAVIGTALVGAFIAINTQVEEFTRAIDFATGETGRGADEFDYLLEASDRLGISALEAADAYKKLIIATKDSSLSTRDLRLIFEAVAGTFEATGEGAKKAEQAIDKIGDAISDNQITFQELQSITKELPGGLQGFADALGVPIGSLRDLTKEGKIGVEALLQYAAALNSNLAAASTDTFSAATNQLKNAIVALNVDLAKTGAFDVFVDVIQFATFALITGISYVEAYGTSVGAIVAAVLNWDFSELPDTLRETWGGARDNISQAWDRLKGMNVEIQEASANTRALARDNGDLWNLDPIDAYIDAVQEAGRDNGDLWKLEPIQAYSQELEKVAEQTQKTFVELEKIASNERIKNLEFKAELDIAQIEAQAQKTVAAFDSISESITSTSDLLGSLFGDLNEADNFRDRFQIEDQIKLENERREEQLELQKRLTETQIRAENARIERMASGDAIININGDGLQPHLEAFMWEILEVIQVRVNADGLDMLLGAP